MKILLVSVVLLAAAAAWAQTYSNINDSTAVDTGAAGSVGWGSCVSCAGGGLNATITSSPFLTTPSVDGSSRDFEINGSAYTDGLWWYKVGPNDSVTHFTFDFYLWVASNTSAAQALEFDVFQFVSGQEYMFGTQCNYAMGVWDVWNQKTLKWVPTRTNCTKFTPNTEYHLTFAFHRDSSGNEHYDSLKIVQYNNKRGGVSKTYSWNLSYPSGPTPAGWTDNMGVQFQMDIGPSGAEMQEWVDEVTLTTS
ncbi:MAG: hypothetical protein WA188_07990 [Terriglobales bacterium]